MIRSVQFVLTLTILSFAFSPAHAAEALIQDRTHESQVLGETRNFRIFLPPNYANSSIRYPVIYWFHGYSERHNQPVANAKDRNYDQGKDYFGDNIANYVGTHNVIVVKLDGYNPRTKAEATGAETYPRPWNIGPVETKRQFPLYFPEFVEYIDRGYRTIADREHRATSGLSMGGFMSFWIAGKYPDMISSASSFMGSSEFFVGPRGFEVEYRHEEMRNNYDGVRTRLVVGSKDFIQFYHRQLNAIWKYTRPYHESEEYDFDHGAVGIARTFDFHMRNFQNPLPRPAVFSHADAYPEFSVWDWEVATDRRQPGFTVLENVSASGFRSSTREWLPSGRTLGLVKVLIATGRVYTPGRAYGITIIRLRDGRTQRMMQSSDREGRLNLTLDGDEYEVGISSGPALAIADYEIEGAPWATAGRPVRARVRFWNKGAVSHAVPLRWETPNPGVQFGTPAAPLPPIAPGKSAEVPLIFTVNDTSREIVKIFAIDHALRLPLEIPLYPPAPSATDFRIADGGVFPVFQRAVEKENLQLGEGNGDGRANPGETIAVLLPDGGAFRAAEVFTNDRCVENRTRISDEWSSYDHVGASAKYSLPRIRFDCPPGHVVQMMTRVLLPNKPNHRMRYAAVEFPVGPGGSAGRPAAASAPRSKRSK